jgi:hypothetical protein
MIENQIIALIQCAYIWEYDFSIESPHDCWAWKSSRTKLPPPESLVRKLTDLFVEQCKTRIIPYLDADESKRFREIMCSMGVTEVQVREAFQRRAVDEEQKDGDYCRDCHKFTTDFYLVGRRCSACHEKFVVTSRPRNITNWSSSGMTQ